MENPWRAGLAYALNLALLGGLGPIEKPIKNDPSVESFTMEHLEDPWGGVAPVDFIVECKALHPCSQVRG